MNSKSGTPMIDKDPIGLISWDYLSTHPSSNVIRRLKVMDIGVVGCVGILA